MDIGFCIAKYNNSYVLKCTQVVNSPILYTKRVTSCLLKKNIAFINIIGQYNEINKFIQFSDSKIQKYTKKR